jgi:hypothetical protein
MGDIRVGGFDFGDSDDLALGYMPPPVNNYSPAGDIVFNTGQVFNINGLDYDLYTVALHEVGHALGLNESGTTASVMYGTYQGLESGLFADDIAGIRSIYSNGNPRSPDAYDTGSGDNSFATAANLTSLIDPNALTALVPRLNINSASDVAYYTVRAPAGTTGTLKLTVQSTGLSLLAPSVRVYNSSPSQIASATGSGYYGSTLTLNVSVVAGQTYYVRVARANSTAFGTGAYALSLNFGSGSLPVITPPNTQMPNGSPLNGGGGAADRRDANGLSVSLLLSGIGDGLIGGLLGGLFDGTDLPFVSLMSVADGRPQPAAEPEATGSQAADAAGLTPGEAAFSLGTASRLLNPGVPSSQPVVAVADLARLANPPALTLMGPDRRGLAPAETDPSNGILPVLATTRGPGAANPGGWVPLPAPVAVPSAAGPKDAWADLPGQEDARNNTSEQTVWVLTLGSGEDGMAPATRLGAGATVPNTPAVWMPAAGPAAAAPTRMLDLEGTGDVVRPVAGLAGLVVLLGQGPPQTQHKKARLRS